MARHLIVTGTVGILLLAVGPAQAGEEKYAERQVFDAKTGQWQTVAPPIAGTEDGDLELARSLLARGDFDGARKGFKAWFKAHADSARRPEALFYAADTEVSSEEAKPDSGDLMQAYRWYEELLEGWAGTELAERAIRRELIVAEMFLFKNKKQRVFQGMFKVSARDEALTMLDRIINEWAPNTPVAEQALRLKGDYHYDNGEFEEAEEAYARLNRDYGRGKYRRFALLRSGESAMARFPGVEFDDADLLEAEVYFKDFQAKYPKYAAEADVAARLERIQDSEAHKDFTIAQYYDRTGKKGAAAYYYRHIEKTWPGTTWAAQASSRLAKIGPAPVPETAPVAPMTSGQPIEPPAATPNSAATGESAAAAPPAGPSAAPDGATATPVAPAQSASPIEPLIEVPTSSGGGTSSGGSAGSNPSPSTPAAAPPPQPVTTNPPPASSTNPPPPEPLEPLPPK